MIVIITIISIIIIIVIIIIIGIVITFMLQSSSFRTAKGNMRSRFR